MGVLRVRSQWSSQPPIGTPVNKSHPLSRGLICVATDYSGGPVNVLSGGIGGMEGSAGIGVRPDGAGLGMSYSSSSDSYVDFYGGSSLTEMTLFVDCFYSTSPGGWAGPVLTANGTYSLEGADWEDGGIWYAAVRDASGVSTTINTAVLSSTNAGKRCTFTISTKVGGTQIAYINGASVGSSAAGASIRPTTRLYLGRNWSQGYSGFAPLALYWSRQLSAAEIKSIHNNPWQVFAP